MKCIYCREQYSEKTITNNICPKCKDKLFDDGLEISDIESFRKNGTEELYYHLTKIDDYFQEKICADDSYSANKTPKSELLFHKRRIYCFIECFVNVEPVFFHPKTEEEIKLFLDTVKRLWEGKTTVNHQNKYRRFSKWDGNRQ